MANYWLRGFVLATVAVAGFGWWQASDDLVQGLAVLAVLLTVTGAFWLSRIQAARRWRTVLDAYAERALAQEQHHPVPRSSAAPKA